MDLLQMTSDQSGSTNVLWLTIGCLVVLLYVFQLRNKYAHWTKIGVKAHVNPIPLISDFAFLFEKDQVLEEQKRFQKYGKIYGTYLTGKPRLFVADPEVLRQILIKDHDAFLDHAPTPMPNKYQKLFLFFLKGDHWKKVRALMTPTFTSSKIKRMFRFMDGCAEDLLNYLEDQGKMQLVKSSGTISKSPTNREQSEGFEVNIGKAFSMYTMDGIASCCYGLKLRRKQIEQQDKKGVDSPSGADRKSATQIRFREDFVKLVDKVFNRSYIRLFIFFISPESLLKLFGFSLSSEKDFEPIIKIVGHLIKKRTNPESERKYDDLLQLLVKAKLDDELELNELDQAENHHAGLTKEVLLEDHNRLVAASSRTPSGDLDGVRMENGGQQEQQITSSAEAKMAKSQTAQMSEIEIISESIFLLAAGLETTSSLLSFCLYTLAYHPEVQNRLYQELQKIVELDEGEKRHILQYESLTSCQYLDAVISETLRLFPPAQLTDRLCARNYYIEKYNITIPKDTSLVLGIRAVQRCADYWSEPDKFQPERFLPENRDKIVPGSYLPFSMGPRHCIGMRFSLTEAKLGLAKVVMKYRVEPAVGLNFPPDLPRLPGLKKPTKPNVRLIERA